MKYEMCRPRQYLVGKTFNYLKVLSLLGAVYDSELRRNVVWECECLLCGNITEATTSQLKNGGKKACGCYRKNIDKFVG